MTQISPAKAKLLELVRANQARAAERAASLAISKQQQYAGIKLAAAPAVVESVTSATPTTAIVLNDEQQLAVQYGLEGKEFCLIGAAGTGKTTTVRTLVSELMARVCEELGTDVIPRDYLACVAFTRRAVRNISKALRPIGAHIYCRTVHNLLEYAPNYDGYINKAGEWCSSMRFEPQRTAANPIKDCRLVIVDEASMLDYSGLYRQLVEACPNAKFIFIGDLNQLPPVFGDAVLGFKLAELPVVELTQVYRQAMESPIIWFQHNYTLKGLIPTESVLKRLTAEATPSHGAEFIAFKQNHDDGEVMSEGVADYMMRQLEAELYDPEQDTILVPFNKAFGSIAINLHIAERLAIRNNLEVHEVIANYRKSYWAVSDFVMFEKQECRIISIEPNSKYMGAQYQPASSDLSRHGYIRVGGKAPLINLDALHDFVPMSAEDMLALTEATEEKKLAASHKITIREVESGAEKILETAGDLNALDYGYCMTIHKSQGSEWRKVWLILHRLHKSMLSRELIYTGMTRAKDKLSVLYTGPTAVGRADSTISRSIKRAVLPGTHWKDKVEAFRGKKQIGGWEE